MDTTSDRKPLVWQPLTPRGVAGFARAPLTRLLLVQFVCALVAAGIVVWFLQARWWPVINTAVAQLPTTGEIRFQKLNWQGPSSVVLAGNRFLALAVDLTHSGSVTTAAHVQVEFGTSDIKISSLLGYEPVSYPAGWAIAFNRTVLQPWWGAWSPMILALVALGVTAGLLVSWAALATLYSGLALVVAFFANRELGWWQSWRIAGAALMPGALFMSGALLLYGMGGLDLVRLMLAGVVHLVIGWAFLVAGALFMPRVPGTESTKANPFVSPK